MAILFMRRKQVSVKPQEVNTNGQYHERFLKERKLHLELQGEHDQLARALGECEKKREEERCQAGRLLASNYELDIGWYEMQAQPLEAQATLREIGGPSPQRQGSMTESSEYTVVLGWWKRLTDHIPILLAQTGSTCLGLVPMPLQSFMLQSFFTALAHTLLLLFFIAEARSDFRGDAASSISALALDASAR